VEDGMQGVNYKIFLVGLLCFFVDIFIVFEKLSHDNFRYYSTIRASLFDGYFGFFITFILMILSLFIISYSLSLDNKFSKIGKYIVDIFKKIYGRR
jgi:hypothetical protein